MKLKRHWRAFLIAALGLSLVILRAMKFTDWDWVTISIVFAGVVGVIISLSSSIKSKNSLEDLKESLKALLESEGYELTNNPEWLRVLVDSEDKIIIGIKRDGSIEWGAGIPRPIREEFEKLERRLAKLEP